MWMHSDKLPAAAHIWAAAAGTAGAYAPRHIADAFMEGRDLFSAAVEGTRRADAEVDEDWLSPRGCEILVERGSASLLWETERHRILLLPLASAGKWSVEIHCRHEGDCERIRAADAARRLWDEHGEVLRQASSPARYELTCAATTVARMLARGEISPADLDIASREGLHALWGVLWAWVQTDTRQLVESILGYKPDIDVPAHEDLAGIVVDTPLERVDLNDAPVTLRPRDTMAAIIGGQLRNLGHPEFGPVIHALNAVAGVNR